MTRAHSFEYADMFGDSVDLQTHWQEKPLLLGVLRDFASASSREIGVAMVRSRDEINAAAYNVLFVALDDEADPLAFMADSGFNSPVGRARAADVATYGLDGDGVFVIDAGEIVHAATPATAADFLAALDVVRAGAVAGSSPADNAGLIDEMRAALASFDPTTGLPPDPYALGPLVYRAMQVVSSPRPEDQALLPALAPLLQELGDRVERIVGPPGDDE